MSAIHNFRVDVAIEVGVNAAIMLEHIDFWCTKNKANGKHFHDGYYWTYNTAKAFREIYPYMSEKAIRTALGKLESGGYIVTGTYNDKPYDRTKWYAVTPEGAALLDGTHCQKGQMEVPKRANGSSQNGNSLNIDNSYKPVIYPFISDEPIQSERRQASGNFTPPTLDEVRAFCAANMMRHVDPEVFHSWHEARGWVVNGSPIVNWQSALASWEVRDRNKAASEKQTDYSKYDASNWERG